MVLSRNGARMEWKKESITGGGRNGRETWINYLNICLTIGSPCKNLTKNQRELYSFKNATACQVFGNGVRLFNRLILDYPDISGLAPVTLYQGVDYSTILQFPIVHGLRLTTYPLCLGLGLPYRVLGDPLFQGACRGIGCSSFLKCLLNTLYHKEFNCQ